MLLYIRAVKNDRFCWIENKIIYIRVLSEAKLLCRRRYISSRKCIKTKTRFNRKAWNGLQLFNYKIIKQKLLTASKELSDIMDILNISGRNQLLQEN